MDPQKIVILGVGSTYFTRALIEGLIRVGGAWEVAMVDIDPRPLDVAMRLGRRIAELYSADLTITGSTDRRDLLAGAGTVVSVIGVGGRSARCRTCWPFPATWRNSVRTRSS